jgi:hypothetical protein
LVSYSADFDRLRGQLITFDGQTYAEWKELALKDIRGHELSDIVAKRYKVDHPTHQISSAESASSSYQSPSQYAIHATHTATSSSPHVRRQFNGCWNCRSTTHPAPECPALYCRCCAIRQRTCQWESITSPGFHRHYQCADCQPQFRIPALQPSAGPFPAPYSHFARKPRPAITPYTAPVSNKRTVNMMEETDNMDDDEFEDISRMIPENI